MITINIYILGVCHWLVLYTLQTLTELLRFSSSLDGWWSAHQSHHQPLPPQSKALQLWAKCLQLQGLVLLGWHTLVTTLAGFKTHFIYIYLHTKFKYAFPVPAPMKQGVGGRTFVGCSPEQTHGQSWHKKRVEMRVAWFCSVESFSIIQHYLSSNKIVYGKLMRVKVNCRKNMKKTILFEQHMDVTSTNLSQNHPEKGFGAQDHPPKKRFTNIRSEGSCQRPLWLWFWMPRVKHEKYYGQVLPRDHVVFFVTSSGVEWPPFGRRQQVTWITTLQSAFWSVRTWEGAWRSVCDRRSVCRNENAKTSSPFRVFEGQTFQPKSKAF